MKNLKIYFTSDLHGYVYPTDYIDRSQKNIGLLNIINQFEKDGNTLIIDAGDTIQGSPFTNYLGTTEFDVHPIAKIFNIAFQILSKNIWYLLGIICIPSASGYFKYPSESTNPVVASINFTFDIVLQYCSISLL